MAPSHQRGGRRGAVWVADSGEQSGATALWLPRDSQDHRRQVQTGLLPARLGLAYARSGRDLDYPAPPDFLPKLLSCGAFQQATPGNLNPAEFCDHAVDVLMAKAARLRSTALGRADDGWARVDHAITDAAPLLPLFNERSIELLSRRVGDYRYNPTYGSLMDQLWLR